MSIAVSLLIGVVTIALGVGIVVLIEGLQDKVRGFKTWLREMFRRSSPDCDPPHRCKEIAP